MPRSLALLPLLALFACEGDTTTDKTDTTDDTTTGDSGITGDPCGPDAVDGVATVTGEILEDTTWSADCTYVLRAGVFVGGADQLPVDDDRVTLTIEAGTRIVGEASSVGMLVINRGGRIMAEGTESDPIVMTSSRAAGERARGDWGGLIINGNATINCDRTGFQADDFCEGVGEGGTGAYGGETDGDDSGTLTYVRVEYAGALISADNELNGIALQGVGSGTTIDYVQVHKPADDGVELFGGTANIKHVVVTEAGDDLLDWTDGWTGLGQFIVLQSSADAAGDQGIEADNNDDNNDFSPRSDPTLSNMTIIGSPDNEINDIGILLREGTVGSIWNTQVVGFNSACLDIDNNVTFTQGITNGGISLQHVILDCDTIVAPDKGEPATPGAILSWFESGTGNVAKQGASDLDPDANAANLTAPQFDTTITGGTIPADSFFDETSVIGAVGSDDWTTGWTSYSAN